MINEVIYVARPIEYNKEEVLSNAMEIFWHKGFESTSMKDLVMATGLTTRSMYNIFESKDGLFQEALKCYYDTRVKLSLEELKQDKGIKGIRSFISKIAGLFETSNGCLYTNTLSDRYSIDPKSMCFVDGFFEELEEVLIDKLKYAKEYEGYSENPVNGAKLLVVIIQGMSVYSKKFESIEERRESLEGIISLLKI